MADPTIFEWQTQDDQGLPNRVAMYVAYNGATATVNSLIGSWVQAGGLVDAVIDGRIVEGRITIPLSADAAWKTTAIDGNNSNQGMVLNFENDFNRYLTELYLPSYREALLLPNNMIDLADPALAALIDFMIDGDVDLFPNSRDLHDLNALRNAFLTTRRVRGQRQKTRVIPT